MQTLIKTLIQLLTMRMKNQVIHQNFNEIKILFDYIMWVTIYQRLRGNVNKCVPGSWSASSFVASAPLAVTALAPLAIAASASFSVSSSFPGSGSRMTIPAAATATTITGARTAITGPAVRSPTSAAMKKVENLVSWQIHSLKVWIGWTTWGVQMLSNFYC